MKRTFTFLLSLVVAAAAWAQVPFKATTIENGEFAEGTTWYVMAIGDGGKLIKDNAGADYITLGSAIVSGADEELWCFVGNDTDGYAVYNKQAGTGKVLASSTTMNAISGYGGTGGSTYPTMQPVSELPEGYVGRWDFASSDKIANVAGYFMRIHGTNYAVNNFGGRGMLAFWAEGTDAGSTIVFTAVEASVEILVSKGEFTASNGNKTWHSKWESSEVSGFSLSANANNMQASGDYIAGYSGQSGTCTYTLTAPEGMVIAGYSFDYANTGNDSSYSLTLNAGGKSYTTSAEVQHIDVEVAEPVRTASFTQSGANKGVTYSNFIVYMKLDIRVPEPQVDVFTTTPATIPYRIPAIATARNGNIIAVADYRHSRADIGMATNGRIDIRARISKDNGKTWGEIFDIIQGKGADGIDASNNDMYVGFGDPVIVADRESDRVLVITCSGNVSFPNGTRDNHQGIAHFYSEDNGETWSAPVDRADHIYEQFDASQQYKANAMFVGSGKISQSQYIKIGDYYRIYCAVLVKTQSSGNVNFVLYSDNFGESWTVLGGVDVSPIPSGGDEPKAEELPDGSVIISSRTNGGRIYNIFSYTNSAKAEGSWGTATYSNSSNNGTIAISNSTNGEILFVPARRKADDKKVYLALQSVPFGSGRANVGIYYKELETLADFVSPVAIAADWDGRHQASYLSGAYSTMCLQHDNNIGFIYEEDTYGGNGGYTIVYKNYSVEYITDSAYVFDAEADKNAIVAAGIDSKLAAFNADTPAYVGTIKAGALEAVTALVEAYKAAPSYEAYEAINAAIAGMPRLEVEEGKWYRIRNSARSGATLYLNPGDNRVSTATSNVENANQLFTFVPTSDGSEEFYLYNGNYQYYLGPLGANETEPVVTAETTAAGKWKISSTANGLSSIICQNNTGGNTGLHLAGDGVRLVPWTNTAEASLWYIEPVNEFALTINEFVAVCMPFAMTLPEGVIAYTAGAPETADGIEYVPLTEYGAGIVAECVPVVLAAESGSYLIGLGDKAADFEGENCLTGVFKRATVQPGNAYKLNGGKFVKLTTAGVVAANAAYYTAEGAAGELPLVKGEATGISEVKGESGEVKGVYDLQGREVDNPTKGIYIINGQKVLVY